MPVPYTFGTATAAIPLTQLDSNFATAITIGNTAVYLGNTTTSIGNLSLANVTITSVSTPITAAQGGTGLTSITANSVMIGNGTGNVLLVAPGTTGNVLVSNGTTWTSNAAGSQVYPGAGIANSTGSAWGTSYTTTGSGTVVALATSPTFVTPALGTPSSGTVTNLTGTASININGTVGATTASSGAFTTLSATGAASLQSATDNFIKENSGWVWNSTGTSGGSGTSRYIYGSSGNNLIGHANGGQFTLSSVGLAVTNSIGVGNTTPSSSGAGITFPAAISASSNANTLDDYEEGTWTPTASNFTVSGNTTLAGTYTKIGRVVYFNISFANTGTIAFGASAVISLPFTGIDQSGMIAMFVSTSGTSQISDKSGVQMSIDAANGRFFTGSFTTTSAGEQLFFGGFYRVS